MKLIEIKTEIENHFGVDLKKKSRRYDLIKLRYLYYHLCHLYSSEITTFQKIADTLGFHHATVMHGLKEFINIRDQDLSFKSDCVNFMAYIFDKYPPDLNLEEKNKSTKTNYIRRKIKLLEEELNK
jgi:hypothetical protein